jgi:multidrug efflux pump subunit AcrA (membrane-fusion protein)
LTVPTSALVQIGDTAFVFQQLGPRQFRAVQVTPGEQRGGRTEIRDGLAPGAVVVAENGVLLQ